MFVSQGIVLVLGKYAEEAALRRGGGVHARPRADVSAGTSAGTSGGVSGDAHTAHTRSLNTASLAPRGGHHNTGALPRDILPLLIMLGLAACSANNEELDRCEDYDVNAATKTGNDGAHPAPQDDAFVMADRVARADACVDGWVQISGKVAKSGFDDRLANDAGPGRALQWGGLAPDPAAEPTSHHHQEVSAPEVSAPEVSTPKVPAKDIVEPPRPEPVVLPMPRMVPEMVPAIVNEDDTSDEAPDDSAEDRVETTVSTRSTLPVRPRTAPTPVTPDQNPQVPDPQVPDLQVPDPPAQARRPFRGIAVEAGGGAK